MESPSCIACEGEQGGTFLAQRKFLVVKLSFKRIA